MQNKRGNKRGQVTLFIIIAVVIVAVVVLFLVLKGREISVSPVKPAEPGSYIGGCVNLALEPLVETIAKQGGYLAQPEIWVFDEEEDIYIGYLCLSTLANQPCVNQQPLLKESIEEQLKEELENQNIISNCIDDFVLASEKKGWDVSVCRAEDLEFKITLTESRVNTNIICPMTLKKGEDKLSFEKFKPSLIWPLYEFVEVAHEIVEDEIKYGDFNYRGYILVHPWLSISREMAGETEIYILEDSNKKKFMFAIRNYAPQSGV